MKSVSFQRRSRFAPAFTLTEVIVSIVIIAVLLAVTSPVVGRMRESSFATGCIHNLRTIGGGLHAYMVEYNGKLPPMSALENPFDPTNKNVLTAQKVLMPYTGIDTSGSFPTADNATKFYGPWICPADRAPRGKANPDSPRWKYANSYNVNYYAGKGVVNADGSNTDARTFLTNLQVGNPAKIWYLMDGFRRDGGQGRATVNMVSAADTLGNADGPRYRHTGMIHVLTLAGGVERFLPADVRNRGGEFMLPERR